MRDWREALCYLPPICAFALGVFAAERIARRVFREMKEKNGTHSEKELREEKRPLKENAPDRKPHRSQKRTVP